MSVDAVDLHEVGPREGFQYEGIGRPDFISVDDKLRLITALTRTGVRSIEATSFVSPRAVPQMADADQVTRGLPEVAGVTFAAIYLNARGLQRAIEAGRYQIEGRIMFTASETFSRRNQNRGHDEDVLMQRESVELYRAHGIPVDSGVIMAAFGCNYEGDVPLRRVIQLVEQIAQICEENGSELLRLQLADTMGWADPMAIRRAVAAVRAAVPDIDLSLHLHDTRGTGMANLYAAMESGVRRFDTSVGGLGGCPFAGVAAGNVATEDVVFMCERMGVTTGIDLDAMIECARTAQEIVAHPLPSRLLAAGAGLVAS
ncbi:hydroxymethylglutaryl-CoA lyase [Dactylosporangium sp. CA-092794]|uniref:hydroxymethylglutaryl-CoA lyase n=1 Tax=Dactylosporangium sp. CA-092794 TaxID=3239929 RepID=UPI003D8A5027